DAATAAGLRGRRCRLLARLPFGLAPCRLAAAEFPGCLGIAIGPQATAGALGPGLQAQHGAVIEVLAVSPGHAGADHFLVGVEAIDMDHANHPAIAVTAVF